MELRSTPTLTYVTGALLSEVAWLSETLTVTLPKKNIPGRRDWRGRPRSNRARFYAWQSRTFPTGLLGYVLEKAGEIGVTVQHEWDLTASILPSELRPIEWPGGRKPRPYQDALVMEALRKGRGIIQAATGSGKTAIAAMILRRLGNPKSLILTGRRSLVRQLREEIGAWLGTEVGEISAGRRIITPNAVVALVPSLAARAGEAWAQSFLDSRRVLMVDESHHVAKRGKNAGDGTRINDGQWYEIAMRCPAPNRYGLSATPLKLGDPKQCWNLIGATGALFSASISATDLIEDGWLARPFIYFLDHKAPRIAKKVKWAQVKQEGLSLNPERNAAICEAAKTLYELNLKVLILVEELVHGRILRDMMLKAGAPIAFSHGGLLQQDQEENLAWIQRDGARVMIATRVLGEGIDVGDLGAIVYARGGKGYVSFIQGIGRVARPKGKDGGSCIVVVPNDTHHHLLERHVDLLRTYLSIEPGFMVAVEGQSLHDFVRAVLAGGPIPV